MLGNHDFAISRDPFSQPVQLVELARGRLLSDESVETDVRGVRVEIAGVDPRSWLAKRASGVRAGRRRRSGSCSATSRACSTASRTGGGT